MNIPVQIAIASQAGAASASNFSYRCVSSTAFYDHWIPIYISAMFIFSFTIAVGAAVFEYKTSKRSYPIEVFLSFGALSLLCFTILGILAASVITLFF